MVVVSLLLLAGCGVWDGAFLQAEYQIKFVTSDGTPVDGVQLEVRDRSGNISYGYPVTDYYAGRIPTSDANGQVTFHHVQYFLEYGGSFFFGCSTGGEPEFDLLFTKSGNSIYDVKFNYLNGKVDLQAPTVTRTVSVYDEPSARAAWSQSKQDSPVRILEQSLEFHILEQTVELKANN